ncbi:MAG: hypothetical protein NZ750_02980 [Anaerolineae bacterium]|nr:hypothetical protein [Anaerolineae bacterium]MDW8173356.1 hypothetical protein [Anaerolineae bacterium]
MTDSPILPAFADDDRPLPLIVAERWNFALAYTYHGQDLYYAVQDWMRGLTGEADTRYLISKFKKTEAGQQMWSSIQRLPYKASDGKTYQRDYATDRGLYLIAQYLRVKQDRPMLDEIRRFLAAAGVFVDEVRREPEKLVDAIVINPDKLLEAFIEYHRKRGKDDHWIQMRIDSKIKRSRFTAALAEFVRDVLTPRHYATATDDIYKGLWGRTAAALKRELNVSTGSLRDYQPTLALHYQGIAEEVCAQKIGAREELWWEEAREIIRQVTIIIGRQARETSELLGQDLATGKPLLSR